MATVLLVDDVEDVRVVVGRALRLRGGFEVVGEAANGAEAIAKTSALHPDLVVLDLGLPDLAGRDVIAGLRSVSPATKVVVFTGTQTSDRSYAQELADAFVVKDVDVRYLVDLLEHLGRATEFTAAIDIPADPEYVRQARRFTIDRCAEFGCHDKVDEAAVIVSELVTNAVIHAHSACQLCVRRSGGVLRIEVIDASPAPPDPRTSDDTDEHGRGLMLVANMAVAWGIEPHVDGGKVVWAEMLCDDPLPEKVS